MSDEKGCAEVVEASYDDIEEATLRGPRLLRRRFATVPVTLGNGEEWQVGGPPLGGGASVAFQRAIAQVDAALASAATGAAGQIGMLAAMADAAFVILRQCYPRLAREQFDGLVDARLAQQIVTASLNGVAPEEAERDLATVTERVAWALEDDAAEPGVTLAQKVARAVVNGIPAEQPEGTVGNDSPPSASA